LETELELAMAKDGLIKFCQYRPGDVDNNQHCSSVAANGARVTVNLGDSFDVDEDPTEFDLDG
jgi:hypothetical protein